MSRTKEYLDELRENGELFEEDYIDLEYEEYVRSLNAMNELFNINVEEPEFKIGDKFKENDSLIAEVTDIREDKYGKEIVYKMIDDHSLLFLGTHLKNEFSFYVGSEHYKNAILNIQK